MIPEKLEQAINDQINKELYSSYLYLSMSAYAFSIDLPGFGAWYHVQAQEELAHTMKLFDYLVERDGRPTMAPVDGPPTQWESPIHVFEETLKHEQFVTERINNLMDVAIEVRDHAARSFLQWFVDEQVEEEANVGSVLAQLKMVNGEGHGLLLLDRELGARTFVMPQ